MKESLFNGYECNDMGREKYLSCQFDMVDLETNPSKISDCEYQNRKNLTQERTELVKKQ